MKGRKRIKKAMKKKGRKVLKHEVRKAMLGDGDESISLLSAFVFEGCLKNLKEKIECTLI